VDMGQAMDRAKQAALRAAWLWTGVELAPGAAVWLLLYSLRRPTLQPPR
jgi:hypothetical protein